MAFVSDLLVAAAALGAALYCFILSRRLQALSRLDGGLGSAIALLSTQVDDLSRTLRQARENADSGAAALGGQTARAEAACQRLELLLATLHDLPDDEGQAPRAGAQAGAGPASAGRAWTTATQGTDLIGTNGPARADPAAGGAPPPSARAPREPASQPASRARIVRRRQPMEQA